MLRLQLGMTALIACACSFAMSAGATESASWIIDPAHTKPSFTIRHMMISNVAGSFDKVSGSIHYDGKNPATADVEAVIDASSIDTSNRMRDDDLKGSDFLDTKKYPTIKFKSKKVIALAGGKAKIIGDLTMHGITKEVTLDLQEVTPEIKDPQGKTRVGATAAGKLNRKDFGISYNGLMDNGGALVGDEVNLTIDVELVKNSTTRKSSLLPLHNRNAG